MKKLMTAMLGLSLILGASSVFAAPQTEQPKKEKKVKKSKKKAAKHETATPTK